MNKLKADAVHRAIALLHSMVSSGEKHTEASEKIVDEAIFCLDDGWISVDENPPTENADYIVFPGYANSGKPSIEPWCKEYKCFLMEIEDGKRVTHYMPVPDNPKEKAK
jgi:hypothetical protein